METRVCANPCLLNTGSPRTDCEDSAILPFLPANRAACWRSWMAMEDMRLLGQKQRTSLFRAQQQHKHHHICISSPCLQIPWRWYRWGLMDACTYHRLCCRRRTSSLLNLNCLWWSVSMPLFFSQKETLPLSSKAVQYTDFLEKTTLLTRQAKEVLDLWKIVLQYLFAASALS